MLRIVAALALLRWADGTSVRETVPPWRTKLDLVLHGNTLLSPLRFHPLEQDVAEFLNRALYPYYGVKDATVASQAMLEFSSLQLTWTLLGVPTSDSNSTTDFLDLLTKALSTREFAGIFSDEWRIGSVFSATAWFEPEPKHILTNDIFDRTAYVRSEAPNSGSTLPTMPPSASTISPSTAIADHIPPDPAIVESSPIPLLSKLYHANMTITLGGISATITAEELDTVEAIAEGFFQDYLPLLHNVILGIADVQVCNQTLVTPISRRLGTQEDLILELMIVGEGWSIHQVTLDTLPFDSFVSHAFETHTKELLTRLQASSAAFWYLDILPPTSSNQDPSVGASNDESKEDGSQPYVTVAIVVCVFCAIMAGVVGGAFYIFHKIDDAKSVCDEDDVAQDLMNEESLSDIDISRLHPTQRGVKIRFKYPIQKRRASSEHSSKSLSILWDSYVENWSVISGPLAADREVFTIQALDEFEASLQHQSPFRGSVENGLHCVDL
ncbi:hypothetical protein MHU86_24507 [Fragilaria crotonensis]|nr:hypothetical protein MHU86_24507 [Fragilaria crotonensis]